MIILVLSALILPWVAKKYFNYEQQIWTARIIAITVAAWTVLYPSIRYYLGDFDRTTDLPIDLCNITGLLLPFLMWQPKKSVHQIFYFWILGGTLQAILTPHLYNGFPNYTFWKYWISHNGLVLFAIYVTVVFQYYPSWKSLFRAFLVAQFVLVFMFVFNYFNGSNYGYVMHKPPTASILDYFGPWPWYIIVSEGIGLLLFAIVLLPVILFTKKEERIQ